MATVAERQVVSIAAVFLCLTWISTLMRVYVRVTISKLFSLEDWFMILATLLFTLTAAFTIGGMQQAKGRHFEEIPTTNAVNAMRFWFLTELTYACTTCMLKLSVALFLLRIAQKRSHRLLIHFTMVVLVAISVSYFVFLLFQCTPVDYFWTRFQGQSGHCLPASIVGALTYTQSSVSASADVALALLPVVIVARLQMNIRTKLTVISILSLGLIACAAVIIRLPYIKILVDSDDLLYSSTNVLIWSEVEPGLAITAANMATLRPLFQKFLSRTRLWGTSTPNGTVSQGRMNAMLRFPSRKGHMRNGSRENADRVGLRAMDKIGITTTIHASDEDLEDLVTPRQALSKPSSDGQWMSWQRSDDGDIERGTFQWPLGITVRQSVKREIVEGQGACEV